METYTTESRVIVNQLHQYASQLMVRENKSAYEAKAALVDKGIRPENARILVENLENQLREVKYERARKNMIFGVIWFASGTIATVSGIGLIFWGAILFGSLQFYRGVINMNY
ncbi:hypothetical protein SGQ44_14010 [Flavobacterium sp. Fl-77]|uniref:Uncharacterized protein n=1 Tax=Flavobacterium flavipigmentatum TaxID=2893884 RepID=A0AAJ2SGP1_9FLAO|nr:MULTISPECIES: hypothetical protein [unclassified Flavobacterium]MDX6182070.1 hypothetical protein [Flavobacterium sp. Fl-33]MDX6186875.1 hypothetical protein [Flavobacterium sp. Fl-77]UFH37010.1 hypothetical protein LNP22_09695 [Flavobacterium sp. F-70]